MDLELDHLKNSTARSVDYLESAFHCGTLVAMVMRLPADAVTQLFFFVCLVLGLVL